MLAWQRLIQAMRPQTLVQNLQGEGRPEIDGVYITRSFIRLVGCQAGFAKGPARARYVAVKITLPVKSQYADCLFLNAGISAIYDAVAERMSARMGNTIANHVLETAVKSEVCTIVISIHKTNSFSTCFQRRILRAIQARLSSFDDKAGTKTRTLGERVFPSRKRDHELGWRLDWGERRWVDGVWRLTLDLQPNQDAALRQLRERARGLHKSLGLLIIHLDDPKKLPESLDVTTLFGTIVDEDDMQDMKVQRREERVRKGKQEHKTFKGNAR